MTISNILHFDVIMSGAVCDQFLVILMTSYHNYAYIHDPVNGWG